MQALSVLSEPEHDSAQVAGRRNWRNWIYLHTGYMDGLLERYRLLNH